MTVRGFDGAHRQWERAWAAAAPVRWVIAHFPTRKGRGRLSWLLARLFADRRLGPTTVVLHAPTGGRVDIAAATSVGRSAIAQGQFEAAELETLVSLCRSGTVAIDVGANVGLFTVALAQAVGPDGRVVAIEPYPPSVIQLQRNVERNGLSNVKVVAKAAGASRGAGHLLGGDPTLIHLEPAGVGAVGTVPVTTLDEVWASLGRPRVSVVKIDVEGMEVAVLEGAAALLATGPAVMVETGTSAEHAATLRLLASRGYRPEDRGLEPWNHLFRRDAP